MPDSKNNNNNNSSNNSDTSGSNTIGVGLDLGSWNARVATFSTLDDGNDKEANVNATVGPTLIHNHDGARATRAAISIQPKPVEAPSKSGKNSNNSNNNNNNNSMDDCAPPPPRQAPPKSVVQMIKSHILNDAQEQKHEDDVALQQQESKEIITYLQTVVLKLACNAAHVPLSQLSVVASIAASDNANANDQDIQQYIQHLKTILESNWIGCLLEPVAVCLAYSYTLSSISNHVLVVDLGGSGLKVSCLEQTFLAQDNSSNNDDAQNTENAPASSVWTLKHHTLNTAVSGPALIDCLGKHVAQQFETKHRFPRGEVWSSKKAKLKLQRSGESALTTLLQRSATTTTIHIDGLYEGMDCQVALSKPRWEMLSSPLANQVKKTIQQALATSTVHQILLSGPLYGWLEPLVKAAAPQVQIVGRSSNMDPSEAVALGCAIHAQGLLDDDINNNNDKTEEVLSQTIPVSSIAIEIVTDDSTENKDKRLINVGTPLPAMATYNTTSTSTTTSKADAKEEDKKEKESKEISIWQAEPTRKKLATLNLSGSTAPLLQMHLSEKGQLSIRIGGETLTIG